MLIESQSSCQILRSTLRLHILGKQDISIFNNLSTGLKEPETGRHACVVRSAKGVAGNRLETALWQ